MATLSNTKSSFNGVFTALVTPFQADGTVDQKAYEALLERQLEAHVHGLVVCGTTGESPTLNEDERTYLLKAAVKASQGRTPVIAGTGSNDTRKTVEETKRAEDCGVGAALIVTPYYNKPSQAGLIEHYFAVAEKTKLPIILYNVPGRTGVSLQPATVAKLATHPRIVGIKEASGSLSLFTEMREALLSKKEPFAFLSGDDPTFWPFLACGGHGVISVASNIIPKEMLKLYQDWSEGWMDDGISLHQKLSPLLNVLFIEPNPVPVKTLMHWKNWMREFVRLPLTKLTQENSTKLRRIWDETGL